jgi:predicted transcriptional regulator
MLKIQHTMTFPPWQESLSRRERQVMDILVAAGAATAADVQARMPGGASYSAVRAVLRSLAEKKLVSHAYDGPRYVYRPDVPLQKAKKSLLKQLLDTFFGGSREELVAALLDSGDARVTPEELDRLAKLIEEARKKGF